MKPGFTDLFLVDQGLGAPPGSSIVMAETAYMTESVWDEHIALAVECMAKGI